MPIDAKNLEFVRAVLAIGTLVLCFFVVAVLAFVDVPKDNENLFNTVCGLIIGATLGPVYRMIFGNDTQAKKDKPE